MSDPVFKDGKWVKPKDPDDIRWYRFGFAKDLADSNTTIHPTRKPIAICSGVSLADHPDGMPNIVVSGTDVAAFVGGLDLTPGAANFCTIRVYCANGEQIDGTMWYEREDH